MLSTRSAPTRAGGRLATPAAALILALVAALTVSACATAPPPTEGASATTTEVPPQSSHARGLIVIVHGAHGTADTWPRGLANRIRSRYPEAAWDVFRVNWSAMSDRYLTAAGNGYALGRRLGSQLASARFRYEVLHLIGSSLGSHVIHGLAEAYRDSRSADRPAAVIHSTFIEPFFARGVFRLGYGRNHFGEHADFAENYFVREEPVPFSNAPLRHAVNFDLTAVVPPREDPHFTYYHDYPIFWYRDSVGGPELPVTRGPGFSLSPLALGAFCDGGVYDVGLLREMLKEGEVKVVLADAG